jgi:hypothetical protein
VITVYAVCIIAPLALLVGYAMGVRHSDTRWRRKPWVYELQSVQEARHADAERRRARMGVVR